jgi:hypothetical protein
MNWIVLCAQPTLRTIKCSDQIQTRKRERERQTEFDGIYDTNKIRIVAVDVSLECLRQF